MACKVNRWSIAESAADAATAVVSAQAATKKGEGPSAIPPQKNARRIKAPLPLVNRGASDADM